MSAKRYAQILASVVLVGLSMAGCGTDPGKGDGPITERSRAHGANSHGRAESTGLSHPADPQSSARPEPVPVDTCDLLVARDIGDTGDWEQGKPDTPEAPKFSTDRSCFDLTGTVFKVDNSQNEAAIGWFDPVNNIITHSGQVVREYSTVAQAKAALADLRSRVRECRSWREGNEAPGQQQHHASRWDASGLPRDALPWLAMLSFVNIEGFDASTWYLNARYGSVISTVASTARDAVGERARSDVQRYADQAGQTIREAQAS